VIGGQGSRKQGGGGSGGQSLYGQGGSGIIIPSAFTTPELPNITHKHTKNPTNNLVFIIYLFSQRPQTCLGSILKRAAIFWFEYQNLDGKTG
jgi:hypothetical protein